MYELPISSEEYKIQKAKSLLQMSILHIHPHTDPFETDEGYGVYELKRQIEEFIKNG